MSKKCAWLKKTQILNNILCLMLPLLGMTLSLNVKFDQFFMNRFFFLGVYMIMNQFFMNRFFCIVISRPILWLHTFSTPLVNLINWNNCVCGYWYLKVYSVCFLIFLFLFIFLFLDAIWRYLEAWFDKLNIAHILFLNLKFNLMLTWILFNFPHECADKK
jgi:hypothetical protein